MKNLILALTIILISTSCKQVPKAAPPLIRDGFYQAMKLGIGSIPADSIEPGQVVISFDMLSDPGEYTKVAIDTSDFVPLELETAPTSEERAENKNLLSLSLAPEAAEKIKTFTAQRVMKQVVIVLDGKAITMHKVREAIAGNKMEISDCDANACEYLCTKMKDKVKQ